MRPTTPTGPERLSVSIRDRARADGIALIPFISAGFPTMGGFEKLMLELAPFAAAIEIGVPFSDPMADGITIQRSSRAALVSGVTLRWILSSLREIRAQCGTPLVLMSYLNPLLACGAEIAPLCTDAGIAGLIVPDLPFEERGVLAERLSDCGIGIIQMVTPVTPEGRLARLASATEGFLYAVTMTGVTGGGGGTGAPLDGYLAACRAASPAPVAAGFGLRDAAGVRGLRGKADAAIVGSALVECLERGDDPRAFLASLLLP